MAGGNETDSKKLLALMGRIFEMGRGRPIPFGATIKRGGVNFAVFAGNATEVSLVLFVPGEDEPVMEIPLDPRFNRTGDVWHTFVRGLDPGVTYGYRVDRKPNANPKIHRYDRSKILIDPYAKALAGNEEWGALKGPEGFLFPDTYKQLHGLVVDDVFDWGNDQPLNVPMSETVIYELHVRGFTRHDSSSVSAPGSYAGLIEKIPYMKELGVTAVELLPVNEFDENESDKKDPATGERLLNYWGYSPINFFAPKASYSSSLKPGSCVHEFKSMVKAMHEAGLEVILDVVFNHTAEGDERGPTLSYRGLDNEVYYMIDPATGEYHNFSGCGNTLNCNHPVVRDLILDALRYWVIEMHVDGFRFDLASILGRGRDGEVLADPPLLERIAADPVLMDAKLIAEAWDAAGLYQVGTFPSWGRWAEWNGRYRDDVRRFVKSDPGMTERIAARLMGSPDIYANSGREPCHGINFITCHDGFTLNDLVSYSKKHNEMNGEDNRDGSDVNFSWNCGHEGPVDDMEPVGEISTPGEVQKLRDRQMRNFIAILFLSRGVPMLAAGDEFKRTQKGNNNAYCQDNEVGWIDWGLFDANMDLHRFTAQMIRFRKAHPSLRHDLFEKEPGKTDFSVTWHGPEPFKPDWSESSRTLAMMIQEEAAQDNAADDLYVAMNFYWEPVNFILPSPSKGRKWRLAVDTSLPSPADALEPGTEKPIPHQSSYLVAPRTVMVLVGR